MSEMRSQRPPRPRTRCRRCGEAYRDHAAGTLQCFGRDTTFHRPPPRPSTSFSWSMHEVEAVAELLACVERHDTRGALAIVSVRGKAIGSVAGKLARMKARRVGA